MRLRGVWPGAFIRWTFPRDGRSVYGTTQSTPRHTAALVVLDRDPVTGRLRQPKGARGCLSASRECAHWYFVDGQPPRHLRLSISPDGRSLYLVQRRGGDAALVVVRRDPATRTLRRLDGPRGCLSAPSRTDCRTVPLMVLRRLGAGDTNVLNYPEAVQVEPDGRSVSGTSSLNDAGSLTLITLPRAPADGGVSVEGGSCLLSAASEPGCRRFNRYVGAENVARLLLAPNGRTAYAWDSGWSNPDVGAESGGLVAFTREPATGALSDPHGAFRCRKPNLGAGCTRPTSFLPMVWTAPRIAPDGSLYAVFGDVIWLYKPVSAAPGALLERRGCVRASAGPGCARGRGLSDQLETWQNTAMSPDGRSLYVGSGYELSRFFPVASAVTAFVRDPSAGGLRQLTGAGGCWSAGALARCGTAPVLRPWMMVVSDDGRNLYVLARGRPRHADSVLAIFARDTATGALHRLPSPHACISALPRHRGCDVVPGLGPTRWQNMPGLNDVLEISKDGRFLYTMRGDRLQGFRRRASP